MFVEIVIVCGPIRTFLFELPVAFQSVIILPEQAVKFLKLTGHMSDMRLKGLLPGPLAILDSSNFRGARGGRGFPSGGLGVGMGVTPTQ